MVKTNRHQYRNISFNNIGGIPLPAHANFNDPDINSGASAVETARSRLLPINFDVAAFIGALKTCTNKELGSYFPGSCSGGGGSSW